MKMASKKGYIISYADWFKGFIIGAVFGIVIAFLLFKGILKVPPIGAAKEPAKMIIPLLPFGFKKK